MIDVNVINQLNSENLELESIDLGTSNLSLEESVTLGASLLDVGTPYDFIEEEKRIYNESIRIENEKQRIINELERLNLSIKKIEWVDGRVELLFTPNGNVESRLVSKFLVITLGDGTLKNFEVPLGQNGKDGVGIKRINRYIQFNSPTTDFDIVTTDDKVEHFSIPNGKDYILTDTDKSNIADLAASKVDISDKADISFVLEAIRNVEDLNRETNRYRAFVDCYTSDVEGEAEVWMAVAEKTDGYKVTNSLSVNRGGVEVHTEEGSTLTVNYLPVLTEETAEEFINTKLEPIQESINSINAPLATQTYSGLYAGANGVSSGIFCPIHLIPNNTNTNNLYKIKYRITTTSIGYPDYSHESVVELYFNNKGALTTYHNFNSYTGSYLHYHCYYHYTNNANTTLTNGIWLGNGISSGNNYNKADYARTCKYEILEISDNLDIELVEPLNLKLYSLNDWYKNNSWTQGSINCSTLGLQETSDSDTYNKIYTSNSLNKVSDNFPLMGYSLGGFNKEGLIAGFSINSVNTTDNTVSMNANRLYNQEGIDYIKGIFTFGTNFYAKGATFNASQFGVTSALDFRYTDNCYQTNGHNFGLEIRKAVYLRGVIIDGLFYPRPYKVVSNSSGTEYPRIWILDLPELEEYDDEGNQYVYWFVGMPSTSTYTNQTTYTINLENNNYVIWFKDGKMREYNPLENKIGDINTILESL